MLHINDFWVKEFQQIGTFITRIVKLEVIYLNFSDPQQKTCLSPDLTNFRECVARQKKVRSFEKVLIKKV